MWQFILSGFVGALFSIPVAVLFYWLSSRDLAREGRALREETQKVRQLVTIQMNALQNSGLDIEFARDERGNIVSNVVHLRGEMIGTGSLSATLSTADPPHADLPPLKADVARVDGCYRANHVSSTRSRLSFSRR